MKHAVCPRHPDGYPCTCAMGNVYRFLEPVVLYMLREKGETHGYQLANGLQQHALTDAEIEGAAMYRTLRRLEEHGYVSSKWDIQSRGPARRIYLLTKDGERHLEEWAQVLENLSKSMTKFVRKTRKAPSPLAGRAKRAQSSSAK
jgi:PadR family transcriptional regulator PadR